MKLVTSCEWALLKGQKSKVKVMTDGML